MSARLRSFASCIELSQPIGFQPTFSYLETKTQSSWRDAEFLEPAMDLLEAERALHLHIDAEYSRLRKAKKSDGFRDPSRLEVTPVFPRRWHGDERLGARHTLETMRRLRRGQDLLTLPFGQTVLAAIDLSLAGAEQPQLDLDELQSVLDWSRRQLFVVGWADGGDEYGAAWTIHRLLSQLHLLVFEVPPVATPWNFRTS